MGISLLFSVVLYQVALSEINARIENTQLGLASQSIITLIPQYNLNDLRELQVHEASARLVSGLIYANLLILVSGGAGCYLLARRSLEPIERAHYAQSRFTSDASHELRTPLAAMKTELEVLLRSPKATKEEMREILESNLEEVNKLTKLSHTLLQLSRVEQKGLPTEKLAIEQVVRDAVKHHKKQGHKIIVEAPKRALTINGHRDSIEELLSILLDNAIKYSTPKSSIHITLQSAYHGKRAAISITNDGDGIPAEHLPYIFDRFYRADSSRTGGDRSGYGLGLSLAKQIVDIHHATIQATSTPGKTTTFSVVFPTNAALKP